MSNTVSNGDFTVQIYSCNGYAQLIPNTYANFFKLKDNAEYSIGVKNNGNTPCDAYVSIDGTYVGTFRLAQCTGFFLERPQGVNKKFVFKNAENFKYNGNVTDQNSYPKNGNISVNFKPAKSNVVNIPLPLNESVNTNLTLDGVQGQNHDISREFYKAGTTVLGNPCTQEFNETFALITDIDVARERTIDVCLVVSTQ
jgi:hypothetical protein